MNNDHPFYIVDLSHCEKQYLKWKHYLPNIKLFYPVKTNENSLIISIIEKMGGGFACVSIDQFNLVLSTCSDIDCSKRIIYTHPCKSISHMKYFKERNVQITVANNESEIIKIKKYWPNAQILIHLKINNSKSLIPFSKKFDVNEHMAIRLFQLAKNFKLKLIGCTFHVDTNEFYDRNTFKHLLEFAKHVFQISRQPKYHFHFKILDIGDAFTGFDEDRKSSFSEMAIFINELLNEFFPNNKGEIVISYR
jgi:ornithine decarboxylase